MILLESNSKYYLTAQGLELAKKLFNNEIIKEVRDEQVKLIIDSREKKSSRDRNYFQSYFNSQNILNETRYLSLGDFLWIKNEKICKIIVERKQGSDLISSFFDGRYKEQKNRLSSLDSTVFYLIEK